MQHASEVVTWLRCILYPVIITHPYNYPLYAYILILNCMFISLFNYQQLLIVALICDSSVMYEEGVNMMYI